MRIKTAFALCLSILLVGTTTYWRISTVQYVKPVLATVEQLDAYGISDKDFLKDFTEPKAEKAPANEKSLSQTDIIGRQMIMDYIALAASGEADATSINNLANEYISLIPKLNGPGKITYDEVKTAPNIKESFQYYSDELAKIYIAHTEHLNTAGISPETFAQSANISYRQIVYELENLAVPFPLVPVHTELVNLQLSNLSAAESIIKGDEDPIVAFAGFVAINENLEKEIAVLKKIEQVLKNNSVQLK